MPFPDHSGVSANLPLVFFAFYSSFYTILEPLAGLSWALLVGLPLMVTATAFQHNASALGFRV